MKKILLTGGSGFVGRNLRESFLSQKYDLAAPARARLDLLDTRAVDEFFAKNSFDCVLHAAVKPCHRNAPDRDALVLSNLRMFENLARNSGSFGRLINFGSGAVYDQGGDISGAREEDIFKKMPSDEHGFCKYAADYQYYCHPIKYNRFHRLFYADFRITYRWPVLSAVFATKAAP